jgi:hypothetical protein
LRCEFVTYTGLSQEISARSAHLDTADETAHPLDANYISVSHPI